jgi:hypothetical protein
MDGAHTRHSRTRTRFIASRDYKPRKRFGFYYWCLQSDCSGLFALGAMSALQKYKVKRLDLFFVTVTNSFLGERVGNQNSNSNFS